MSLIQLILVSLYGGVSFASFIKSVLESVNKKNSYGNTYPLYPLGIFVWGDGIVLGLFWTISSVISLILNNFLFFLVIISIFWVIRSYGEMTYWFHQQFSPIIRIAPENLFGYKYIKKDSIWFMYQVLWQCLFVISILSSIYFTVYWIKSI